MSIHHGISCDLCRTINFSGRRYKCLICNDFDLCSSCFDNRSNLSIQTHAIHHPMQLILKRYDYEHIYFENRRMENSLLSLTCPFCNQNGFMLNFLIKHINEEHRLLTSSVLCPICFIRQTNLNGHLHKHIEENINLKIISTKKVFHTSENEEVKLTMKSPSHKESLLERLINNDKNKNENENEQRNLFINSLLTDYFSH